VSALKSCFTIGLTFSYGCQCTKNLNQTDISSFAANQMRAKTDTQPLSEHELCPDDLLEGQKAAFARDIARLHARGDMVLVVCPACGSGHPSKMFEKDGFSYQRCDKCRTIYMSPRPSVEAMTDYYSNSENYAYWAKHIFPASEATRREKIHRPWLERVVGYMDHYQVPRGILLEVGPGFGTFSALAAASEKFMRVMAIEPVPDLAAACRSRGVDVIEKRVEDAANDISEASVVCAFEVIEHLFEPRQFIDAVHRLLAPGGLLVLSCPNGEGFDIATLGAGSLAVDAEHVNLFNPASLQLLVEAARFEVLVVHTPGRLDAEFVREAAQKGEVRLDPFLKRVLLDEWDRLGWPFQNFLAEHGLSSHMWLVARRNG
jgi:2-polyprenyl-6-hydroxyphenyl methylase/3-demethylubiquinone-9 3-methyltransferase